MQKVKGNIILTILLSILALGSGLLLPYLISPAKADNVLPEGWIVAGVTNVLSSEYEYNTDSGWKYDTESSAKDYISYQSAYDKTSGKVINYKDKTSPYVMLENFVSEQELLLSNNSKDIQNFYVGFGKKYSAGENIQEILSISNAQVFLKNDYVYEKYAENDNYSNNNEYGIYIKSNKVQQGENVIFNSQSANSNYWYNYFDLTEVYAIIGENETDTELVHETEGLYTVVITYTYNIVVNNEVKPTNGEFVYQFYLLKDSTYYETPDLNRNVLEYNKNNNGSATYYNEYQQLDYPTYVYNARKFNASYEFKYNDVNEIITTEFSILFDKDSTTGFINEKGKLVIYKNGSISQIVYMKLDKTNNLVGYYDENDKLFGSLQIDNKTYEYKLTLVNEADYKDKVVKLGPAKGVIDYYYCFIANKLGEYTFNSKCIISNGEGTFDVMDFPGKDLLKNVVFGTQQGGKILQYCVYNDGYINFIDGTKFLDQSNVNFDMSKDGEYKLYNYGTQSYFYKNDVKTDFNNLTSETAIRSDVTPKATSIFTILANITADEIPNTNLQSIYFDYFGRYAYSGSTYKTTDYYLEKNEYKINENNKFEILPGKTPSINVLPPTTGISNDGLHIVQTVVDYTNLEGATITVNQYYMFIIDNTAPKVSFKYKDLGSTDVNLLNTSTKYTNKDVILATWNEPNFFQGEITAEVKRYAVNADERNTPLSTTDYINGNDIMLASDGTTLPGYYVLTISYGNKGGGKRDFIFIKDIEAPTANAYLVNKKESDNGYELGDISDKNLFNSYFTIAGKNIKDSGAMITAYYIQVPFDAISNFKPTKFERGVTTNFSIDASNPLFDEDNFEKYNLNENETINLLGQDGNMIYIFKLEDSAGNVSYFYYIYDTTTPRNVILDENNNMIDFLTSDHTSDKKLSAFWGQNKLIEVKNSDSSLDMFNNLITFIENNKSRFYNLTLNDGYLELALNTAKIESSINNVDGSTSVVATTQVSTKSFATSFTGYLPSQSETVPTDLSNYWSLEPNTFTSKQFFVGSKSYDFTVFDVLGNRQNGYFTINTDKAALKFNLTYGTSNKTESNVDYNRVYNAKELKITYNSEVSGNTGTETATYTPKVSYDYYPFSFSTYLSDNEVNSDNKKNNVFSTKSYNIPLDNGTTGSFIPSYPFASTPSATDVLCVKDSLINNDGNNLTAEGLYVFKRVYVDKNGAELDDDTVKEQLSEDDIAVLYRIMYVDRNGVFEIAFDSDSNVSITNSIGDYLKIILGDNTENESIVDSALINTLLKTSASEAMFDTNKVSVNFEIPQDKYATEQKLNNDSHTTFNREIQIEEATGNVINQTDLDGMQKSIEYNQNMFGMFVDLSLKTTSSTKTLIEKNKILEENKNIFNSLNSAGVYTLTIYDNSYITTTSEDGQRTKDYSTANKKTFQFQISHTSPQGEYISALNSNSDSEIPLSISEIKPNENKVIYISSNRETLKFRFEDTLDIYSSKINPNKISISKNGSPILYKDGDNVTLPTGVEWENIFNKEVIECQCICENCLANNHDNCSSQNKNDLHAFAYTYTIFDKFNSNVNYLSNYEDDAVYTATIQFIGDESSYTTEDGSFFTTTFEIYIDRINPSKNLQMLIASDEYYQNQDITEYFFPISIDSTNPTIFDGSDKFDSTALFIRKIANINNFIPSLLPNEEGYNDPSISANPRFSELSNSYKKLTYESNPKQILANRVDDGKNIFENNCYYEIVERDEAGNYTKYYVFAHDSESDNLRFEFYKNADVEGTNPSYAEIDIDGILKNVTLNDDGTSNFDTEANVLEFINVYKLQKIGFANSVEKDVFTTTYIYSRANATQTLLETVISGGTNESLDDYFARVVSTFEKIALENPDIYEYSLVFTNRHSDKDYVVNINRPGSELILTFVPTVEGHLKVTLPEKSSTVQLISFTVEKFNSGWIKLDSDLYKTIITSGNPLEPATYEFDGGQYKFTTIDNFGRINVEYKFVGSSNDGTYQLNFQSPTITEEKEIVLGSGEKANLVTTSKDVQLNIDETLWDISVEMMNNANWETFKNYTTSSMNGSPLSNFTFSKEGIYKLTLKWATSTNDNDNIYYYFKIDKTIPTLELWSESGIMTETEDSSYTENFTIEWDSKYDLTATLIRRQYNNKGDLINTSTLNFDNNTKSYYVEASGEYVLTITDVIGNVKIFKFTKTQATYTYFAVKVNDAQINYSDYTSTEENRTAYYYYVNYTKTVFDDSTIEYSVPTVELITNLTKGIESTQLVTAVVKDEFGKITDVSEYDRYRIFSTINNEEYIICYVYIVYVQNNDNFANVVITDNLGNENIFSKENYNVFESSANSLEVSFKEYNFNTSDQSSLYRGNFVYADYYYNGVYQKTISVDTTSVHKNEQTFTLKLSGLHSFKFYDYSGNIQKFKLNETSYSDMLDIYLVNDIMYTINNGQPIENAFFNDSVTLKVFTKVGNKILFTESPIVTATLNNQELELENIDDTYILSQAGYYTINITGSATVNGEIFEFTETYNFTIINKNIAQLSFSMPSSYGFTIKKLLRNDGDITSSLESFDSLWLASGEFNADNALYTVVCEYFNDKFDTVQEFSFKIWINDSTPVIVPVDYTYGTSTKKNITLQFDAQAIYNEIGEGYILIKGIDVDYYEPIPINALSASGIQQLIISKTGTYSVGIYNNENRLISSYKVIKKQPLNTSYKIIIIVGSLVIVGLAGVFIYIRKRAKFR